MRPEEERYMAFEGLVQWTQAVVGQARRVQAAKDRLGASITGDPASRRAVVLWTHVEDHFFIIAANKLIEYRHWVATFGLCSSIDFREIDRFSVSNIKDLRNMREHVVEYFRGEGRVRDRWVVETPEYRADASSVVGPMLGGRLDWVAFATAAERLLPALLAEPIPYPSR